jgi:hypothetical protein
LYHNKWEGVESNIWGVACLGRDGSQSEDFVIVPWQKTTIVGGVVVVVVGLWWVVVVVIVTAMEV